MACQNSIPSYQSFDDFPVYAKEDLGVTYGELVSTFKLWSPEAEAVQLRIYRDGLGGEALQNIPMRRGEYGVWIAKIQQDLNDHYYTYQIKYKDIWLAESADPYATACGPNGQRAMIANPADLQPLDWQKDERPPLKKANDMVIYEMHIRDFSIHKDSGIRHKGQFLGVIEPNTQTPNGTKTGLAHLQELGVTHVHLLPCFDFQTIDETLPTSERSYNWGYDPHLYNVPEGSYATYVKDGRIRVREMKEMIQGLHRAGIRVIMDVVYNHTGATETSVFNQTTPNYYYRQNADGSFSNASGCGNEIASERPMVRKFILNSVQYWAKEYHIDGFRFDLMGIHDVETMRQVRSTLDAIDPSIFVYGEGWLAGDSPLPEGERATKNNVPQLNGIAAFSDEIRDAIKGHVFTPNARGFVSGEQGQQASIQFGIVGGTQHPQIDYEAVNYTDESWSPSPQQCIVYASCHDNHTLWDRLYNSATVSSETDRIKMQQLALGIVLTAQGVPFIHAGSEFCRSKSGEENSYKSPDSINQLDWNQKEKQYSTVIFVKEMIALRQAHPAFRMASQKEIAKNLRFLASADFNGVAVELNGAAVGDSWKRILVFYNPSVATTNFVLPKGNWIKIVDGAQVNPDGLGNINVDSIDLSPIGLTILREA